MIGSWAARAWGSGFFFLKGLAKVGFLEGLAKPVALWSPGPWSRGPWSRGLWSSGPAVLWSPGPLVPRSSGPAVLRSRGPLVPWFSGPVVLWSRGPLGLHLLVPWSLVCRF